LNGLQITTKNEPWIGLNGQTQSRIAESCILIIYYSRSTICSLFSARYSISNDTLIVCYRLYLNNRVLFYQFVKFSRAWFVIRLLPLAQGRFMQIFKLETFLHILLSIRLVDLPQNVFHRGRNLLKQPNSKLKRLRTFNNELSNTPNKMRKTSTEKKQHNICSKSRVLGIDGSPIVLRKFQISAV